MDTLIKIVVGIPFLAGAACGSFLTALAFGALS